jgi:hypothetical protein
MLQFLIPAAGALLGGVMGHSEAQRKHKEAARREKYNRMVSEVDQRLRVFGGGETQKLQEIDPGMSPTGAMLSGGLGGVMTGMNIYGGMKDMGLGDKMGDVMKNRSSELGAYGAKFGDDMAGFGKSPAVQPMNIYPTIRGGRF